MSCNLRSAVTPAIAISSPTLPKAGFTTQSCSSFMTVDGHTVSGSMVFQVRRSVDMLSQTSGNRFDCTSRALAGLLIRVLPWLKKGTHCDRVRRVGNHSAGKNLTTASRRLLANDDDTRAPLLSHRR